MKVQEEWKARYLELAEQQDRQQSDRKATEQLLCRTIIRLTLATSGLDPALDPHLSGLRDLLRKGITPDLKEQIEVISEALIHADELAAETQESDLFKRLTSRVRLQGAQQEGFERLAAQISEAPMAATDQQLDELLELMADENRQSGFFGRIFQGGRSEGASGPAPNRLLLGLLEKLSWPGQMSEDIALLEDQLVQSGESDTWIEVIEILVSRLSQTIGEVHTEVQATEGFLQELLDRLKDIERHVGESAALREHSMVSGRGLEKQVQQQVGGIRRNMKIATTLSQLRDGLGQHIDAIETHVQAHIFSEEERYLKAKAAESALRERLRDVEEESMELRKKVIEAHLRANTDSVTGLPNRMAYEQRISQEFARWKRFAQPLSLLLCDIDDFKLINDRFGHRSGDKALKVIGQLLLRRLRETDFVARFGGEEFVMLLPGAMLDDALAVAEKTRKSVQQSGFHSGNKRVEVTLSCGVSDFREGDDPEIVFNRADKAMYQAKKQGKNCSVSL